MLSQAPIVTFPRCHVSRAHQSPPAFEHDGFEHDADNNDDDSDGGNNEYDAGNDDDDDGGDDEDDAGLLLALDSRQARCELFFCSEVTNRGQQLKVFNLLIPKLDRFFVGFVFLTICLGFGRSGASKHSLEYYFCTQ